MRYIVTADNHTRSTRPLMRTDKNFLCEVMYKWEQIIKLANQYDAHLLCAGDIFHTANPSFEVFNRLYVRLIELTNHLYMVAGQHDLKNHSPFLLYSPIYTLHNIHDDRFVMSANEYKDVHGYQWEQKPKKEIKGLILLTHKCVTPKKPPHFLDKAISAKKMLKKYPNYQYIVTGDYHVSHATQIGDRWLINPGSMLRSNIDQINHKPSVYLIDTDTNLVERIYLKVKPAEEVFDFSELETKQGKKQFQNEMKELIHSLKLKTKDASFKKILKSIMKKSKTSKEVKKYIQKKLKGC